MALPSFDEFINKPKKKENELPSFDEFFNGTTDELQQDPGAADSLAREQLSKPSAPFNAPNGTETAIDFNNLQGYQDILRNPDSQLIDSRKLNPEYYYKDEPAEPTSIATGPVTEALVYGMQGLTEPLRQIAKITPNNNFQLPEFDTSDPKYISPTAARVSQGAGELAGMIPGIGGAYATTGKLAERAIAKFAPDAPSLLRTTARGYGAGIGFQTGAEGLDAAFDTRKNGDESITQRLKNIAVGGLEFAAGDAALSAVGRGLKAGASALRKPQETLPTFDDFVSQTRAADEIPVERQAAPPIAEGDRVVVDGQSGTVRGKPVKDAWNTKKEDFEYLVEFDNGFEGTYHPSKFGREVVEPPVKPPVVAEPTPAPVDQHAPRRELSSPELPPANVDWVQQAKRNATELDLNSPLGINQDDMLFLPKVPEEVLSQYDGHGMAKGYGRDIDNLIELLTNGVDINRPFYTSKLSSNGSGMDVFQGGSFIVTGGKGQALKDGGIKNVIVNDVYYDAIPQLEKAFPEINFIKANELPEKLGKEVIRSIVPPKVQAPESINIDAPNIRANYKNQVDNGNFSDELQSGIRNTDQTYEQLPNSEALATVNKEILDDLSGTEARFHADDKGGAEQTVRGYRLMQELDRAAARETDPVRKESFLQRAVNTANKLAADLTKAGQTVQAASVLSRLSPEGQLLALVRRAKENGKEVSVADSVKFKELAAKVQERSGAGKEANEFNEILNRLEKGENVGADDLKKLSNYISGAEKVVKPKPEVVYELPKELKDPKKRDKVIAYFDDVEQAALERIAARKGRMNSMVLPDLREFRDHAIVVASQTAKGTIKAATHIEDMVKLFGEEIRPVATQVFQNAQKIITGVSRGAAEGNMERAGEALRRMTGEAEAEKAIVEETANHVRKLIADAKAGNLDPADVQKLRDYADEIVDTIKDKKPGKLPTQEERYLQSVKALAKKIAKLETEKVPADQANREVSSLLRQITKIADEGKPPLQRQPIDNKALSDIANDVMEKTRPNPKPTTPQEKIVEKYIKQNEVSPRDIDTLRQLAKDVARLSGDQKVDADIAMQKILNSYEKSTVWGKAQALRYIAMLLNTSTQAINAGSGPVMATTGAISDVFGTMLDIAMSATLKTPRSTTMYGTNPMRFIADYWKGLKTGAKAGWHGVNPAGIQGTNEIRGLAFKSNLNPLNWAERTLGAVAKGPDFATYSAVYKQEIRKQGFLDATSKGIKGKQNIDDHVEQFVNDPPEAAALQADRIGKNTTFQRSDSLGGQTASALNSGTGKVKKYLAPITHTIFPFVRTPINIASTAVTLTPAGIIKGLYQLTSKSDASRREAIRTLSLGVTGSAGLTSLGYYLSGIGVITGSNDSGDKNVDNVREQAGKGKYRFNTSALQRYMSAMFDGKGSEAAEKAAEYQKGDEAFDYNKMQPLAFSTAVGASFQESKGKPMIERVGKAFEDSFGSLFGMSTLRGVQDVFQPQFGGTVGEKALGVPLRLAESYAKSFSPSALAQEARRQDPIVRGTAFNDGFQKDVGDYYKSRIPGLSQSLPPRKTTLGQNKMNAPGVAGQYLNPLKSEVAPYNEAAKIITDLIDRTGNTKLAPTAPDKSVSGKKNGVHVDIKLEPKRYEQMQEEVGKEIIEKVSALPKLMTDDKRMEQIEKIYSKARERAANKAKRELGIRVQ